MSLKTTLVSAVKQKFLLKWLFILFWCKFVPSALQSLKLCILNALTKKPHCTCSQLTTQKFLCPQSTFASKWKKQVNRGIEQAGCYEQTVRLTFFHSSTQHTLTLSRCLCFLYVTEADTKTRMSNHMDLHHEIWQFGREEKSKWKQHTQPFLLYKCMIRLQHEKGAAGQPIKAQS